MNQTYTSPEESPTIKMERTAQFGHMDKPVVGAFVPSGQTVHTLEPTTPAKFPSCMQCTINDPQIQIN